MDNINTNITIEGSDDSDCKLVVSFTLGESTLCQSDTELSFDEANRFVEELNHAIELIKSNK